MQRRGSSRRGPYVSISLPFRKYTGKAECFLYSVLEHCRQQRAVDKRDFKAILIYPMNMLATDQAGRLAKEILTRLRRT
ncbi:MAG: hypothetical protein H7A12_12735 [Pseudomonadales bacterium]|nr:hypothetical protein [Pseudomonadales bacterium]MCP5336584.1 hypothetical protein [Pseudomonadales bacterium]